MHVAFKPLPFPEKKVERPDVKDQLAYGKYVAHGLGDCFACHSADFKTMNVMEPEKSVGYLGGGNPTLDSDGKVVASANLTMDPETGIGKWTEEQFVKTLKTGIRPDGRPLRYPMMAMPELSDDEVKATFAYLKTVPVIKNNVDRGFDKWQALASASEGEKLFHKYACTSCHGEKGVGLCDLREASKKYPTDDKLSEFIHDAGKFVPGTRMPTWGGTIQEAEYPSLIAHVRKLETAAAAGKPVAAP
jgi:mono/diheme cytochrome c family protein